jgi:hypothetical protein
MQPMTFFDSNICYGPASVAAPGAQADLSQVLSLMRCCGVDRALVTHTLQAQYHPVFANLMLQEELTGQSDLLPVWALLPHHTGEFPAPDALRERLEENRIWR